MCLPHDLLVKSTLAVPGLEAALAAAAVPQVALRHLRGVDATALAAKTVCTAEVDMCTHAQREREIYIYMMIYTYIL